MKLGMAVRAYNPSTQEMEAEGPEIQSHPQLCNEFEASLKYMEPCPLRAPTTEKREKLTKCGQIW